MVAWLAVPSVAQCGVFLWGTNFASHRLTHNEEQCAQEEAFSLNEEQRLSSLGVPSCFPRYSAAYKLLQHNVVETICRSKNIDAKFRPGCSTAGSVLEGYNKLNMSILRVLFVVVRLQGANAERVNAITLARLDTFVKGRKQKKTMHIKRTLWRWLGCKTAASRHPSRALSNADGCLISFLIEIFY